MVSLVKYTQDIPAAVPTGPLDYTTIAAGLASDSIGLLSAWLPAGKKRGKNFVVGNLQGERGDSLSIDLNSGKWIDFASGDAGTDLISLYARINGLTNHDAAIELAGPNVPLKAPTLSSIPQVKADRVELTRIWNPAPSWQEKPACRHVKFGAPSMVWQYRDEGGRVVGIIARYDPAGERKQFVPWTWNGSAWEPKGWPELRPLYGLHELMRTDCSVLLVEGEKACEAARKLVGPDWFVTTWPGGAQAINRVDWAALHGRSVLMWPDADEPGVKAMATIAEILEGKAEHISTLDVGRFPAKWDAADALADGWDQARFDELLSVQFGQPAEIVQLREVKTEANDQPPPKAKPVPVEYRQVPPHLLTIPGVLGDGVTWMMGNMMTPQAVYAVQAMLALGSVALGRNHTTTYDNWSALYYCVIGGSGTGKESIKGALDKVLTAAGMPDLAGFSSYSSGAGLMSALIAHPNHLHITDEFGKYLESLKDKGNGLRREVAKLMVELWGRVNGIQRSSGMSTNGMTAQQIKAQADRFVIKPSMTQVAMTTPDQFYNALTTDSINDGFLNRFLTVHCRDKRADGDLRKQVAPPQNLVEWVQQMATPIPTGNLGQTVASMASADPVPHVMNFDSEAEMLMRDFRRECVAAANLLDEEQMGEMWGRSSEISMRLSMVVARSCGSQTIRGEHIRWSQDYVRHHTEDYVRDVREHVSDNDFAAAFKEVERLLRKAGQEGMTEADLHRASKKMRKLSSGRTQADVIDLMRRRQQIETVERRKGFSCRGRLGKYHIWIDD